MKKEKQVMGDYRDLLVFKKGMEIVEITKAVVESFTENSESKMIGELMLENAYIIPAKIANAEGGDLYTHRLDMATLIKLAARELHSQTTLCKHLDLTHTDYIELLQAELERFRDLFLTWVSAFDKSNDVFDEWNFRAA